VLGDGNAGLERADGLDPFDFPMLRADFDGGAVPGLLNARGGALSFGLLQGREGEQNGG
jgi:hypothetical protein